MARRSDPHPASSVHVLRRQAVEHKKEEGGGGEEGEEEDEAKDGGRRDEDDEGGTRTGRFCDSELCDGCAGRVRELRLG